MGETYDPDEILADPESHPVHRIYAHINKGIRDNGEEWAKCANCGSPYQTVGPIADESERATGYRPGSTVCSKICEREYDRYMNSGDFW